MQDIISLVKRIKKKGFSKSVTIVFQFIKFRFILAYQKIFILEAGLKNRYTEVKLDNGVNIEVIKDHNRLQDFIDKRGKWYYDYSKDLLDNGNYCFAVNVDGKIVSCLWTSFNFIYFHSMKYFLPVNSNVVPLIDAYTITEYRGKGFYKTLWNYFVNYLIDTGKYDRIYVPILSGNKSSLQVHGKLGADKIVMRVVLIKGFGFVFHFIKKYS